MSESKATLTDVIYFELNNWECGKDYPDEEPFISWMNDKDFLSVFASEDWVRENQLVVRASMADMSLNVCVTAPQSWVEKNCPNLLTAKNLKFIYPPAPDGEPPCGRYDYFEEYTEPYIGKIIWSKNKE